MPRTLPLAVLALALLVPGPAPSQAPVPPINLAPQWPASQATVTLRIAGEAVVLRGNGQSLWYGFDAARNYWRFYGSGIVVCSTDTAAGKRQDWTTKAWDAATRTLTLVPTLPGSYAGMTATVNDL